MYPLKLTLRAFVGRLWPFAVLLVGIGLVLSGDRAVHELPLARAIFEWIDGVRDQVGDTFIEVIGWTFMAVAAIFLLRALVGALASDKALLKRITAFVRTPAEQSMRVLERRPEARAAAVFDEADVPNAQSRLTYRVRRNGHRAGRAAVVPVDATVDYLLSRAVETWRSVRTFSTTATVEVDAKLPRIVLRSRLLQARDSALRLRLGNRKQFVSLEGSFSEYFDVYVARGYEIYALELLTPDVMVVLESKADIADIAFVGRTIVFSRPGWIHNTAQLDHFEGTVADLTASLTPYLRKQSQQSARGSLAHERELFDARVYPVNLISDRILLFALMLLMLFFVIGLVGSWFVHDTHVTILGEQVAVRAPFSDGLNLFAFGVLAFGVVAAVCGEVEVAVYRFALWMRQLRVRARFARHTRLSP